MRKTEDIKNKKIAAKREKMLEEAKKDEPIAKRYSDVVSVKWWRARAKAGVEAIFKSPSEMQSAIFEYFDWCADHPHIEVDFRGKELKEVHIPKKRCLTVGSLAIFLGVNLNYFTDFYDREKKKYEETGDEVAREFTRVIACAQDIIREEKFVGAASEFYNSLIISRDLGLRDKSDLEMTAKVEQITGVTIVDAENNDNENRN